MHDEPCLIQNQQCLIVFNKLLPSQGLEIFIIFIVIIKISLWKFQVVVFSPARSIQYLNITEDNVVKVRMNRLIFFCRQLL